MSEAHYDQELHMYMMSSETRVSIDRQSVFDLRGMLNKSFSKYMHIKFRSLHHNSHVQSWTKHMARFYLHRYRVPYLQTCTMMFGFRAHFQHVLSLFGPIFGDSDPESKTLVCWAEMRSDVNGWCLEFLDVCGKEQDEGYSGQPFTDHADHVGCVTLETGYDNKFKESLLMHGCKILLKFYLEMVWLQYKRRFLLR